MNYHFFIQSLGCKVNQYDGASLASDLEELGFEKSKETPDLVILNTCTVTKNAIAKDRYFLSFLKKKYPNAKLVVMGCWPQTAQKKIDFFDSEGVFWWGVGKREEFLVHLQKWFNLDGKKISTPNSGLALTDDWSRYFLKVGDGCNQFCSYCLIPYARGPIKSRQLVDLVSETKRALDLGLKEIVLTGIHLGRYGQDFLNTKTSLGDLLRALLLLPGLGRLRLSSIEINEVDDELIELIKNNPQICRHLHISLQSGCDKILKLMRRPYGTDYFLERIKLIRRELPDISLTTDVIVGFPGETKEDFLLTKKFIQDLGFSKIHVFPFSAHEKTLAFSMADQVEILERKRRAQELRDLSKELENNYQEKILALFQGKELLVVLEALIGEKIRLKTEYHFDLFLPILSFNLSKGELRDKIGQILTVKID
jgi:threonylcarbamoyladenosine tRNA methylthiotransferase MtaB